ncbi:hypothetical protein RHIZ404_180034 [Rhizobium sp. EC-SD404]|nr:hypothetical protein RHIZ404_180034 [Rhizobium sp. EC-SD404]
MLVRHVFAPAFMRFAWDRRDAGNLVTGRRRPYADPIKDLPASLILDAPDSWLDPSPGFERNGHTLDRICIAHDIFGW